MCIELIKAKESDIPRIWEMQKRSFKRLLKTYEDYDTSPACEGMRRVSEKFSRKGSCYYLILENKIEAGVVRIVDLGEHIYRISPIFVLPEFQNRGIAQKVFMLLEDIYEDAVKWTLDTILQEKGNCHLYEKLGYQKTGKQEVINDKMTLIDYEKIMYTRS